MFMRRFEPQLYAILRIVAGFLFLWHGSQKILGFPPTPHIPPLHVIILGGGVELICGSLILLGLFTHWAAFLAAGEMAYAYWFVHSKMGWLPLVNQGEMAVLYCFLFLYISARGGGIWSLDSLLWRGRGEPRATPLVR